VFGCKRLCSGTAYYETFNRANVTLVDVSGGKAIERFTRHGLRAAGQDFALDAIICATGFDAMTGSVTRIRITGRGGITIADKWRKGPDNYLGLAVAGFPNMFNMVGVGGPSVLATMVTCAEQHGDWIADAIASMRERGASRLEARPEAEAAWGGEVATAASASIRSTCNSWYLGANVAGKARVFMPYLGGFPRYVETCNREAANGYPGFQINVPRENVGAQTPTE
jgi:cation diffusion facilitator CzcD-associated flavoprotein CzcO